MFSLWIILAHFTKHGFVISEKFQRECIHHNYLAVCVELEIINPLRSKTSTQLSWT